MVLIEIEVVVEVVFFWIIGVAVLVLPLLPLAHEIHDVWMPFVAFRSSFNLFETFSQ